jgi:hypothetical protein
MFSGAKLDPRYVFEADSLLRRYLRTQAGYRGQKNGGSSGFSANEQIVRGTFIL